MKFRTACILGAALFLHGPLRAANPNRDFSGTWLLDRAASNVRQIAPVEVSLTITQNDLTIECSAGHSQWIVPLDGSESKFQVAGERWNSAAKWEGPALLINSLVMGTADYTVMDRWLLAPDRQSFTIARQVLRGAAQSEGLLMYRRPGAAATPPEAAPVLVRRPARAEAESAPAPPAGREYVVPVGTRVLLSLVNSINTKHSRDGDPVYLETAFPVTLEGRIVIPRGSSVTGTVSTAKRPGKVAGKGELFIRFDQLTLPNGVSRDFRSRLGSADGGSGKLDRNEGAIHGTGNRTGDARTVGTGAGAGATLGGVIGRSAGAAGIGGAAGAAAGLATVLMKRGPDPSLPRGTQVEMILDRDLRYRDSELPRR